MLRKQYYFCFMTNKLELLQNEGMQLQDSTYFKLKMYRNNRMVAETPSFLSVLNQHNEILFHGEIMKFKLYLENETSKQVCQIRLLLTSEEISEKIIGRYQFLLNNYIKAFQDFHRNRIQLNVQIGQNYIINYDVFIENSEEAITRIIKEHQTAKKFNIHNDAISEIDSFLPHQIINENLEEIYKEIKIDEQSPLLLSQRFWSPKRKNSKHLKKNSIISQTTEKALQVTAHSLFDHRISFLKLNKLASSSSQLHPNKFNQNDHKYADLDIQSQNQSQSPNKNWLQLYEVIQSDSKIIFNEDQQEKGEEGILCHSTKQNKQKKSSNRFGSSAKHIILIAIVVTVLAFFIFLFDKPGISYKRIKEGKRRRR